MDDILCDSTESIAQISGHESFARYPSGVTAVCARGQSDEPHGLTVSSLAVGVSHQPPCVSLAVQHSSSTWPKLRASAKLGLSVLADGQQRTGRQLSSPDRSSRFDGLTLREAAGGALFVEGAAVWLQCHLVDEHAVGDHQLVVLEVEKTWGSGRAPLVFVESSFKLLA
jgi:flavin reductase (DIM6/NTAB) family NADH-FMN oxidoreductase RutF